MTKNAPRPADLLAGDVTTKKTHKKAEATVPKSRHLSVELNVGESRDHLLARVAASPYTSAAGILTRYRKEDLGELALTELVSVLKEQAGSVKRGDLSRVEAMLSNQATALDTIFAELARRAAINMGEYLDAAETYLKLALRAQSQCRATLETLATIKNPPVVIARQANIAHGPQQVNNEAAPIARTGKIEHQPNELLERDHGEWMDTRATSTASASDPSMAAVEIVDRTTDDSGQEEDKK